MKILDLFNERFWSNSNVRIPYIIAEAGVNHECDINNAFRLIDEAKEGGANAIKFQTYRAGNLACKDSPAYWDTSKEKTLNQYDLFKKYDKFWKKEFEQLKLHCDKTKIEFLSTPFDIDSANFLNDMMDVFKISSSDITNKPFIEYLCNFGKPIILSTGASYTNEIEEATRWVDAKEIPIVLLHCILNYPTSNENANLGMIIDLQKKFPDKLIGYSDHTMPGDMKVLEIATLLGAAIIEKHFTLDKTLPGNDHYHSMDKEDLKLFFRNLESTFILLGKQTKIPLEDEIPARLNARRSLVASSNILEGTIITPEHLVWKRPAYGISPKHINAVVGMRANKNIATDQILKWDLLTGPGSQKP